MHLVIAGSEARLGEVRVQRFDVFRKFVHRLAVSPFHARAGGVEVEIADGDDGTERQHGDGQRHHRRQPAAEAGLPAAPLLFGGAFFFFGRLLFLFGGQFFLFGGAPFLRGRNARRRGLRLAPLVFFESGHFLPRFFAAVFRFAALFLFAAGDGLYLIRPRRAFIFLFHFLLSEKYFAAFAVLLWLILMPLPPRLRGSRLRLPNYFPPFCFQFEILRRFAPQDERKEGQHPSSVGFAATFPRGGRQE